MKQCKICYLNIKYNTVINNRLQDNFLLSAILKIYTFHGVACGIGPSLYTAFLFLRLVFCTWYGATDTLLFYAHFSIYSYCQVCVCVCEGERVWRSAIVWDGPRCYGRQVPSFLKYLLPPAFTSTCRIRRFPVSKDRDLYSCFVNGCCVYQ
jgi:hypothetical protein